MSSPAAFFALVRNNLSAALAFALLAFQVAIPWSAKYFMTQDGPSHLYSALVARDLLRSDSPYARVYTFHSDVVTNWGTTVLFNLAYSICGPMHAERVIATLCIITAFLGIAYFIRSIHPVGSPWSPFINFLTNSWFLWIGFYNFYLGMALLPFIAGYYIRNAQAMTVRRIVVMMLGLVLLFFTHVLPLGLAIMSVGVAGVWITVLSPWLIAPERRSFLETIRNAWKPVLSMFVAITPAVLLLFLFLGRWDGSSAYDPALEWAWSNFPMHVFASARGRTGEQLLLYPAVMFFIGLGILGMRRHEWASVRGAVIICAALAFILYLVMPNAAFNADEIKIRMAWAIFLFACPAVYTLNLVAPVRTAASLYVACFLIFTLIDTMRFNVRSVSRAVEVYAAAIDRLPAGATFLRIRYPAERTKKRFGFEHIALDPLIHTDSWVAAHRRLVALTDYQAITHTFPVTFRPEISMDKQYQLWDLENDASPTASATLRKLRNGFDVPVDYIIVLGDGTPGRESELASTLSDLGSSMRLVATDSSNSFVRIYQRISAPAPGLTRREPLFFLSFQQISPKSSLNRHAHVYTDTRKQALAR
jgi:hypothetical protein